MLLKIIRYIKGYIRIRVIGYSAERFLNACSHKGIFLWGLKPVDGAYEMNPAVKADYQEDRNKSCNCETVRSSFFFTQISKAETVLRRSLSFHCHDYSDVPVYMEYRHYRQPVADR